MAKMTFTAALTLYIVTFSDQIVRAQQQKQQQRAIKKSTLSVYKNIKYIYVCVFICTYIYKKQ